MSQDLYLQELLFSWREKPSALKQEITFVIVPSVGGQELFFLRWWHRCNRECSGGNCMNNINQLQQCKLKPELVLKLELQFFSVSAR